MCKGGHELDCQKGGLRSTNLRNEIEGLRFFFNPMIFLGSFYIHNGLDNLDKKSSPLRIKLMRNSKMPLFYEPPQEFTLNKIKDYKTLGFHNILFIILRVIIFISNPIPFRVKFRKGLRRGRLAF